MANDIRYEITAGPSKMDLMLALFDQPVIDGTVRLRSVRFTVESVANGATRVKVGEVDFIITAVARAEDSCDSWNFEGRHVPGVADGLKVTIKGYYSTYLRKGVYRCIYGD